jgi:serine/threonine protein kinase/tetratricopeptide (TPR) repeat protein
MNDAKEITMTDKSAPKPDMNDFATGAIVFDRFKILEPIASGAKGRVYRALDTILANDVALKVLLTDSHSDRDFVRFQSEAKLASKMHHQNIATIYDFGLFNGIPFLCMEFVEGESLEAILERQHTLTLPEFLEVFFQVCDALNHAHKNAIVHRDIKPANIAVSKNADGSWIVKVLDFGVAKNLDDLPTEAGKLTPTGNLVGSPLYMSPEQGQGKAVTTKSDNYSLGCVMWHCLKGSPPFVGETSMETILQHINSNPPKLNDGPDHPLPENFAAVIEGLLSKDPDERPDIEKVVIPALLELQETPSLLGDEPNDPEFNETRTDIGIEKRTAAKPFFRNRKFVLAALASVLLLVGVGLMIVSLFRTPELPKVSGPQGYAEDGLVKTALQVGETKNRESLEGKSSEPDLLIVRHFGHDDDLKKVVGNRVITRIDLSDNSMTDKVFEYIAKVPNLERLFMNRTKIVTLENLDKCSSKLTWLEFKMTNITDQSLTKMLPLKNLRYISINDTLITDKGVHTLTPLKLVSELDLTGTKITSKCLDDLLRFPNLVRLTLRRTAFEEAAARKILLARPKLLTFDLSDCPKISEKALEKMRRDYPLITFEPKPSYEYQLLVVVRDSAAAKNYTQAIAADRELIDVYTRLFGPRDNRVADRLVEMHVFYSRMQQYDKALECIEKAQRLGAHQSNPFWIRDLYLDRFTLYDQMNKPTAAIRALEQALKLDMTISGAISDFQSAKLLLLAQTMRKYKFFDKAIAAASRSLAISEKLYGANSPQAAQVLLHLGECYRESGRDNQAIAMYKRIIAMAEKDPVTYSSGLAGVTNVTAQAGYSAIEIDRKNWKTALAHSEIAVELMKSVKLQPFGRASILSQRADILQALGRIDESKAVRKRVLRLLNAREKRIEAKRLLESKSPK